jgi:hypothetical protein
MACPSTNSVPRPSPVKLQDQCRPRGRPKPLFSPLLRETSPEVYVCDAVRPDRFLVRNLKVAIRNAQLFLTTHVSKHRQAR